MILDTVAALEVLKHCDIRVARSRFVDSAEDALEFATRRDAPDPRFVPIVLRRDGGSDSGRADAVSGESVLANEAAVRQVYAELADGAGTGKILAQVATPRGTDVRFAGRTDSREGKVLGVYDETRHIERMVPLGDAGAEYLAANVFAHGHRGPTEQGLRMLEHLLARISAFYEEADVMALRIVVRLHENSYTVIDAEFSAPRALHFNRKLAAHAHDRKGADFHSSGRQ